MIAPSASFHGGSILLAGATTWLLLWLVLRSDWRLPLDRPNARSLHSKPVPRIGGMAMLIGIAVGALVAPRQLVPAWPLAAAAVLALVSFVDDWRSLPMTVRLATHLLVTIAFVIDGLKAPLDIWESVTIVLCIVWMTNLYNFMDGSDGLAGGMAVIGFSFLAARLLHGDQLQLAQLSAFIVATALAFLYFNFHPAKVFMGDAGSIPLGFLVGVVGCYGWARGSWPAWYPIVVFSPFIVDATFTLLARIFRRERFWEAHRQHAYQLLVQRGMGHRRLAMLSYGIMAVTGVTAWVLLELNAMAGWFGAVAIVVALAMLLSWVTYWSVFRK